MTLTVWFPGPGRTLCGSAVALERLARQFCADHQLGYFDLIGQDRRRDIAWPRQQFMAEAYALNRWSYGRIGKLLGGRDHTTIRHGALAHTVRSSHLLSDINTSSTSLNPPNPAGVALVP